MKKLMYHATPTSPPVEVKVGDEIAGAVVTEIGNGILKLQMPGSLSGIIPASYIGAHWIDVPDSTLQELLLQLDKEGKASATTLAKIIALSPS